MGGTSHTSHRTRCGLDRLIADADALHRLAGMRVGLLTNHASTDDNGTPASLALTRALTDAGGGPPALFSPEHGIALGAGAGEHVADGRDPLTDIPVTSLYGPDKSATAPLADLDVLVIDLRDVGVRCYTYAATAARAARAVAAHGRDIIVCDRANPIGNATDGPVTQPGRRSILAFFDVPFVHGMTMAGLVAHHLPDAQKHLTIYGADGHDRSGLGWVPPSPALAHPDSVAAYAGLVLLEATNVSEGRGSSLAFRSVSDPALDAEALAAELADWETGFAARPATLTAMRGGDAGRPTPSIVIWPRARCIRRPLALGVHLLVWLRDRHPGFAWRPGVPGTPAGDSDTPDSGAIDALFGHDSLRRDLEAGKTAAEILDGWRQPGSSKR